MKFEVVSINMRAAHESLDQHTFAKRQREMEKKAKAEAKRARRTARKQGADASNPLETPDVGPETGDESN